MACPRIQVSWLCWLMGVLWIGLGGEGSNLRSEERPSSIYSCSSTSTLARARAQSVPLNELPSGVREKVQRVLDQPTLFARGPAEEFRGQAMVYHWLLDHPDRAALAWQRLGAPCLEITDQGGGRFGWSDGQDNSVRWETIYRNSEVRIWYAEGSGRPSPIMPLVPVRAVVILHYGENADALGRARLFQQAELFAQTDSKTAALVARVLGPSMQRLTEQALAQLEMFFSCLLGYLDRHPDQIPQLLSARQRIEPTEKAPALPRQK
jgi:hypothetical protein